MINQLGVPGTEEFPALWDFQCYSKKSSHELVTLHLGKGEVKELRKEMPGEDLQGEIAMLHGMWFFAVTP